MKEINIFESFRIKKILKNLVSQKKVSRLVVLNFDGDYIFEYCMPNGSQSKETLIL